MIFLYSADGETKRRVGGPRSTTTNRLFFNQLASRVAQRINQSGPNGQLYQLDGRLRPSGEEGLMAVPVEEFLRRFHQQTAPLWQRLALCKARTVSGSRRLRQQTDLEIATAIQAMGWHARIEEEIVGLRMRTEATATEENLKRGPGGTVDVEVIAQMLVMKHAKQSPQVMLRGTTQALEAVAKAGHIDEEKALKLVHGYRVLRRLEAGLRLLNTPDRHELPRDPGMLKNLAFLMNESDPTMILALCQQIRQQNRQIFHEVVGGN